MSTSKKRKINVSQSDHQLTAFAARRALQKTTIIPKTLERNQANPLKSEELLPNPVTLVQRAQKKSEKGGNKSQITQELVANFQDDNHLLDTTANHSLSGVNEESTASLSKSRGTSPDLVPERSAVVFSTCKLNKRNHRELENGTVVLILSPGQRLIVLGQYDIFIHKGEITLLGATLKPSKKKYRVFAPLTHALPVIRCLGTSTSNAEISLHPVQSDLELLKTLSPLFSNLWSSGQGSSGFSHKEHQSTRQKSFDILFSPVNGPQKSYIQPLLSPPEWNAVISACSETSPCTRSVMVSGPKSSGKSTFVRLLINKILSKDSKSTSRKILLLDLDPGQPEYSPPGQISLIQIQELNFGTPFSHPIPSAKGKMIRSHFIGGVTPAIDSELFMACAHNLISECQNLLLMDPNYHLVINTPGWILGTGLEILIDVIEQAKPTEIIYMSQDGPSEVVESLRDAAKSTKFFTLPSQGNENMIRTSANLRAMQYMSFFHLDLPKKNNLTWNARPLTSIPPWEINYSGKSPGILGILCYGEQPPASLLLDMINGSLVSIVVIDDMAAIPGWNQDRSTEAEHDLLDTNMLGNPSIIRSPEDLPYFNPANSVSLRPESSHCVGLALVRGIDVARRRIQVLTPIAPDVIAEIQEGGKNIVLVHGKLETPGWAYTEESIMRMTSKKQDGKAYDESKIVDPDIDQTMIEDGVGPECIKSELLSDIPWVEKLETSQGRGIASRVWRVRRDLGKTGENGE
ncbi:Polynucleotide 5'-hydroxyl-kinase [Podosphaera aphanis]|nr:Polynucleotide 5'-hydroxyl-kinase [Podosphaera aphanis]